MPVLKGQTPADWRKSFYYHYYEHPAVHNVARQYGVVTDRYKLVHFYEPEFNYWELFDLKTDPHEMKSVYDDPQYADVQKDLHQELDRLRAELKVPEQDPPGSIIPAAGGEEGEGEVVEGVGGRAACEAASGSCGGECLGARPDRAAGSLSVTLFVPIG